MPKEFSVCQFFAENKYSYVCRGVSPREAVQKVKALMKSNDAQTGITKKILIIDADDYINFEWEFGMGVTFPIPE